MKASDFFEAAAAAAATETVDTPAGPVVVRGLTGEEYDRYEAASVVPPEDEGGKPSFRADRGLLVRLGAVDPAFTDLDLGRLRDAPVGFLKPLVAAITRLSGATAAAAEAVEKN